MLLRLVHKCGRVVAAYAKLLHTRALERLKKCVENLKASFDSAALNKCYIEVCVSVNTLQFCSERLLGLEAYAQLTARYYADFVSSVYSTSHAAL
jgi:hypothetical protein